MCFCFLPVRYIWTDSLAGVTWSAGHRQEAREAGDPYGGGHDCGVHGGLDAVRNLRHPGHHSPDHRAGPPAGFHSGLLFQNGGRLQPHHLRLHEQTGNCYQKNLGLRMLVFLKGEDKQSTEGCPFSFRSLGAGR